VFAGATAGALDALANAMDTLEVEAGSVLVHQGELADRVFMVLEGSLSIALESSRPGGDQLLGEVGPGDVIGEVAVLSGTRRTATVRARTRVVVGAIDRDNLFRVIAAHPELVERLLATSLRRLRRSQLAAYLSMMFGPLESALLDELEPRIEWVRVRGGEALFRPGDPGDALYIVLAGRLRVIGAADRRREAPVEEIGRGQPIGMTSLLTRRPRNATVVAIRDTDLARITAGTLRWFTERHPAASIPIMAELADRLERSAVAPLSGGDRTATFAILPHGRTDVATFAASLSANLAEHGRVAILTSADTTSARPEGAGSFGADSDAAWKPLQHWLDEREAAHDYVIYVGDSTITPWTDQCLRQADHVLVVADATADPAPSDVEAQLTGRWTEFAAPRRSLVLLQPDDLPEPRDTARWLAPRSVDQHVHIRRGSAADLARLGRLLSGHGICLVLGGGGARGYAHIGVVRALEEAGVPIDMVGGTSMGALIGAGVARRWTADKLTDVFSRSTGRLFDPTPPIVSLMSGQRIWRAIDDSYHGIDVEDLWLPFFCVSTNLTRAIPAVHRSGPLSRAIRASASLPGILPPVYADGDLLVDGGLLDTLPVGVMRQLNGGGRVIAVDVAPTVDVAANQDFGNHLSGWRLLRERIRHPRTPRGIPGIFELLSRTVAVPGLFLERHLKTAPADLLLRPPVEAWDTLDLARVQPIAEAGYQFAVEPIREWWMVEHPPDQANRAATNASGSKGMRSAAPSPTPT
jgi:predicted acylesterase/phospholipase RssA/CRP-like cAMP-binding protein